jgi:chromate reductase
VKTIAVLLGSLSENSINKALAGVLEKLGQACFRFDYIDLAALPHYNDDLWASPPASVTALKRKVGAADGVLIVTPELNRSFPGLIKNALDWGSRPWGQNSWAGKPLAVVGATPGNIGTAAGQGHLRAILPVLGFIQMAQPEVYFTMKPGLIDEHAEVTDDQTRAFLAGFIDEFDRWIDRFGEPRTAVAAE